MNVASSVDISNEKLAGWVERFRFYRKPPSEGEIRDWIERFHPDHASLAEKILDNVELVSEEQIQQGYRLGLETIAGWNRDERHRTGRWFFVGLGTAGESGPAMVRTFREANNMSQQKWHSLFIEFRELPKQNLTAFDKVIFIDDFSGSGSQIAKGWPLIEELVASEAKLYLLLTAITADALEEVQSKTDLEVVAHLTLDREKNVMSDENQVFSQSEKEAIVEYGRIAWDKNPAGYKDCGLLFVLSHKTPNNSLPIIHANHSNWVGLFPRNLLRAH
jgi:hypothetical protein